MNFARLALKNIQGSSFRSTVVLLCTLVVAGFALAMVIIIQGADQSLRLALERLGADIVVVPEGAEVRVENALLMGETDAAWMPARNVGRIAAIPGVRAASPQIYLSTLTGETCCAVEDMFLLAFDPATDFTVQPWLISNLGASLKLDQAIGGRYVFTPPGDKDIVLYGYHVNLVGNMEPTGTNLDASMFLTVDTARAMAQTSLTEAAKPLVIPDESISTILVKLETGRDPDLVAASIAQEVPGVTPLVGLSLFDAFRRQISALLRGMVVVLSISGGLSLVLLALVFSMVANERRREFGVLRALGATKTYVFASLLSEAATLALVGGAVGIALASLVVYLFRSALMSLFGVPFLFPSAISLAGMATAGILLSLVCVMLAALVPAIRISQQEPAMAMRE
jgi:putative ABC transport system permease protein